jgi:hypothetical protein
LCAIFPFEGLVFQNGMTRSRWRYAVRLIAGIGLILLVGCARTNHYLIHPREAAPEVIVWSGDFARDQLQLHIEGRVRPA